MTPDRLVFVPDVGFRPAEISIAATPVSREGEGLTVTVQQATSGPDGTEIAIAMTGVSEWDPQRFAPWAHDPVSLRDDTGRVTMPRPGTESTSRRGNAEARIETVYRKVILAPLAAGTRSVLLQVGDVTVPLEFGPSSVGGVRADELDASALRDGVSVAARRIARSPEVTAIVIEVSAPDEEGRVVRAIGTMPNHRSAGSEVKLRDDKGNTYEEQSLMHDFSCRRDLRETVVFRALDPRARHLTLEVDDVSVTERTENLTLPVGFVGEITLGGLPARATVRRVSGDRGSVVEAEIEAGAWRDGHRLLYPNHLALPDASGGSRISVAIGRPVVLSIEDPSERALKVTLGSPLVNIRGPWLVEFDLPGSP